MFASIFARATRDSLPLERETAALQRFTMNRFSVAASLAALSARHQRVFAGWLSL